MTKKQRTTLATTLDVKFRSRLLHEFRGAAEVGLRPVSMTAPLPSPRRAMDPDESTSPGALSRPATRQ